MQIFFIKNAIKIEIRQNYRPLLSFCYNSAAKPHIRPLTTTRPILINS